MAERWGRIAHTLGDAGRGRESRRAHAERFMLKANERRIIDEASRHYEAGRLQIAQEMGESLIKGKRGPLEAWHLVGLVAMRREQVERALECFQHCARERPNDPRFQYLMGKMLAMSSRHDEALARYDWALTLSPGYEPAVTWKAALLERQGRTGEVRALLEPHLAREDHDPEMDHVMARVEHAEGNLERCVEICQREIARPGQTLRLKQLLTFLLGRTFDRMKDYDRAFEAFSRANAYQEEVFDFEAYKANIEACVEVFCGDRRGEVPTASRGGEGIVMIAAMPRSGTTLVETIIDAHPGARGIGETADLDRVIMRLPLTLGVQAGYPSAARLLDQRTIDALARDLDRVFRARAPGAGLIVNKHLQNWLHVGFMSRIMPSGRVIWVHRDPRDNCLGIYMQHFNPKTLGYAVDLRMLARAHKLHMRIMREWTERLDYPILEVPYESLVEDPETWTRRIIEFCGLPWDDACLRYYEKGRVALTHSYEQVRQPIYKSAIGRWKRYEKHLAPLLDELERGSD